MDGKQNGVSQNGVSYISQASWGMGILNNSAGLRKKRLSWVQVSGASGSWVCVYCTQECQSLIRKVAGVKG